MSKRVKKLLATMIVLAMAMVAVTGCSFSVGNSNKNDDYKDLFPDRAAKLDSAYKTSNMGYKFTLGEEYGEMMVYVDTSDGHSFEVVSEPAGFRILDKDGSIVIYAACMDKDQYAEYSSYAADTKTVNGRDFLYMVNGDGSEDCFSYMADCGLDCGLVLEVHDNATDLFELLAFRGEPIEGASSDVHFYQGEATVEDVYEEEDVDTDYDTSLEDTADNEGEAATLTQLSDEVEAAINSLDTDYSLIQWGVRYSVSEELPGIVISVTPCVRYGSNGLLLAVTNLYDQAFSFSGAAEAKDANDNIIGDTFVYNPCIGPANTIVEFINCDDGEPDGRISWSDINIREGTGEYVPWEADFRVSGNASDGYLTVDYELYASNGDAFEGDLLTVLLLNENGYVITGNTDFMDAVAAGEKYTGSLDIYEDAELLKLTKGIAMFANPLKDDAE